MKRLLISLLLLILTVALLALAILSQDETDGCTSHKDFNGDLKCDSCNEEIALNHTAHEDADGDKKCDVCGEKTETSDNPDGNETLPPPCNACIDENADNVCDVCGKKIESPEKPKEPCEVCVDEMEDGFCDECGKEIEASTQPDNSENMTPPCEVCVDENKDGSCDTCYSKIQQTEYPVNAVTINGEDIKNHVIAYDSCHNENKLLAVKIQNLIYENLGILLKLLDCKELAGENYIAVKSAVISGGEGFYVKIKDKNLEIISEFPNKTLSAGENYFSALFENPSETVALTESTVNVRDVYYRDFGAAGDGVTNDFEAIKEAHDYANTYGHTVIADKKATYYIGPTIESIIIKTSVNWFDATFILDDSDIYSSDLAGTVSVFTVVSDYDAKAFDEENEFIKSINNLGGLASDTKRIDLGLECPALLLIENSNHKNFIRCEEDESSNRYQKEIVIVDKDGFISAKTPIAIDYELITGITAYRIDDAPITISGGTFIRKVNSEICDGTYYERNILICRSNVSLEYIRYVVSEEASSPYATNPYSAFLKIVNSSNVQISNCTVASHALSYPYNQNSATPLESYVFSVSTSNDILWYNCFQTDFYKIDGITPNTERSDIMHCDYSKNLTYRSCTLSVFSAGIGTYNISIFKSTLTCVEAVGAGTLHIEDSYVYDDVLINLIEKYGSYWNGDIIIKNCFMNSISDVTVIGGAWYNHYFGYSTRMPKNITIDSLEASSEGLISIFDSRFAEKGKYILKDDIDGQQNLNKMLPTESVTIKNNTAGYIFFVPDTEYFDNTIITED